MWVLRSLLNPNLLFALEAKRRQPPRPRLVVLLFPILLAQYYCLPKQRQCIKMYSNRWFRSLVLLARLGFFNAVKPGKILNIFSLLCRCEKEGSIPTFFSSKQVAHFFVRVWFLVFKILVLFIENFCIPKSQVYSLNSWFFPIFPHLLRKRPFFIIDFTRTFFSCWAISFIDKYGRLDQTVPWRVSSRLLDYVHP